MSDNIFAKLLLACENAHFACGEWNGDNVAEYGPISDAASEASAAVLKAYDALRAEVEALRAKIKDHNDDCLSACVARGANGDCEAWTSRGMKCCDCPTDDMIEIDGAARQPPEGQKP